MFDRMTSAEVVDTVWQTVKSFEALEKGKEVGLDKVLGECVNNVLRRAMLQQSEDNLTVIIVCFKNLLEAL